MKLKIKMIQRASLEIEIADDATLGNLRDRIYEATQIPITRQRLIFQGKALVSDNRLVDYGLRDGLTLHMVERPVEGRIHRPSNRGTSNNSSRYSVRLRGSGNASNEREGAAENPGGFQPHLFSLNADMNIPRISTWYDVQSSTSLVRNALENVLRTLPMSTSSTLRVVNGFPRQGDLSIFVRIFGNAVHVLDSRPRILLLRAAEALSRCQMALELLKNLSILFLEHRAVEQSSLLSFYEIILDLEDISKESHADCVAKILANTSFSNSDVTDEALEIVNDVQNLHEVHSSIRNNNILYCYSSGQDYQIILEKMQLIQQHFDLVTNQYIALLNMHSSPIVKEIYKSVLNVFQENMQRVMRRISLAHSCISQVKLNLSDGYPFSSLLPCEMRRGTGYDWSDANISIYFRQTSESPRVEAPLSTNFEVTKRSSRSIPYLLEESYGNNRWLNRPSSGTRSNAESTSTGALQNDGTNVPESTLNTSSPVQQSFVRAPNAAQTRRFRFSGPYLTATFGLVPSTFQSGQTRELLLRQGSHSLLGFPVSTTISSNTPTDGNVVPVNVVQGMVPGNVQGMVPGNVQGVVPRNVVQGVVPGNVVQGVVPGNVQGMVPGNVQGMVPRNIVQGVVPGNVVQGVVPGNVVQGVVPGNVVQGVVPGNVVQGVVPGNVVQGVVPGNVVQGVVQDLPRMDFFHFAFGMQRSSRSGQGNISPIRRALGGNGNASQFRRRETMQNAENTFESGASNSAFSSRFLRPLRPIPDDYNAFLASVFTQFTEVYENLSESGEDKQKADSIKERWEKIRVPQVAENSSDMSASQRLSRIIENVFRKVIVGFVNANSDPSIEQELARLAQEDEPYEHQFTVVGEENSNISDLEMHEFLLPDNVATTENVETSTDNANQATESSANEEMMQVDEPIEESTNTMEMDSNIGTNVEPSQSSSAPPAQDRTDATVEDWRNVLPADWVQVIESDRLTMSTQDERHGLSDAYLSSGLDSKKLEEKLSGQTDLLLATMNETLFETSRVSEIGTPSGFQRGSISADILETFQKVFDSLVVKRLNADSDFDAEKFPELQKFTLKRE